jgi:lipopolysaccharide export system protein LptC
LSPRQLLAGAGGEPPDNSAGRPARNEPDYIIDRFSLVRMNCGGPAAYIISGDKLTHNPVDDASDIDKPYVHSLPGQKAADE